ncbi:type II toxin-antitoxin system RelE/ParE family toxin [Polymorphospora sp. NPDC051019]|uniref:type II toxin-antitoxin system RelE family toxin n=1 Tax=Polymorphospora sp. NPDC051019 TaxID=3155725 RepID=UPI0034254F3A
MTDITFTDAAIDDLRRIGPDAVPKVLRKVLILTDDAEAGYPLGGELTGFRKLLVGRNTWRVVYRITDEKTVEICEIWAVGARADAEVYRAATARIRAARDKQPALLRLTEVIAQIGRLAGDIAVEREEPREPVPDWLANRLIHTAGVARTEVAAMDLQQAVDRWTAYTTGQH